MHCWRANPNSTVTGSQKRAVAAPSFFCCSTSACAVPSLEASLTISRILATSPAWDAWSAPTIRPTQLLTTSLTYSVQADSVAGNYELFLLGNLKGIAYPLHVEGKQ